MAAVKPRGERIGWTRAEVSGKEVCLLKSMVHGMVNLLLKDDPLPEGYELTYVALYYRQGDKYEHHDEFNVMADFDEPALSVFRLEGVKK